MFRFAKKEYLWRFDCSELNKNWNKSIENMLEKRKKILKKNKNNKNLQ